MCVIIPNTKIMYLTWFVDRNVSFPASCPWPYDFETKSSPAFQINLMRWPIPIFYSGTHTRCFYIPFLSLASVLDWTWSSASEAPGLLSVVSFQLKINYTSWHISKSINYSDLKAYYIKRKNHKYFGLSNLAIFVVKTTILYSTFCGIDLSL